MRVVLSTIGSDGDAIPFVAIAKALRARGHKAQVCSWPKFASLFTSRNIEFVALGPDFDLDSYTREVINTSLRDTDPRAWLEKALEVFVQAAARTRFDTCRRVMIGADIVLCNSLDLLGQAAAESAGIPWFTWSTKPLEREALPLSDHFFSELDLRANAIIEAETGVRLRARAFRNMSRHESYFGVSPVLIPGFVLPSKCLVTGTCFLDDFLPAMPPRVSEFLNGGEAPIVVTFGSSGRLLHPEVFDVIVTALRRSRKRVIVHAMAAGVRTEGLGNDWLFVESMPYSSVFPRATAVIHHGGAGTTAEVCRAGVPSITIPYLDTDQAFWSQRIHDLGLAAKPLTIRNLNEGALSARLRCVATDTEMRTRVREVASRLQAEDGAAFITERLETFQGARQGR